MMFLPRVCLFREGVVPYRPGPYPPLGTIQQTPTPEVQKRAVHILLECFLIFIPFSAHLVTVYAFRAQVVNCEQLSS